MLTRFIYMRLFAVFLILAQPGFASGSADVVGEAFAPQNGDLLYKEYHYCEVSISSCRIVYKDVAEREIARKELDYSINAQAPTLQFRDFRHSREIKIELSSTDGLVVDAGFDNFIRSRWENLRGGAEVDFQFQLAGRDKPLNMVVRGQAGTACGLDKLCLEVALDSWLLSKLTRPIQLTYDSGSRRLIRYRGISNIMDAGGRSQDVDILYHYRTAVAD